MRKKRHTKLVHEGQYVAEVDVELIETDEGWSPYSSSLAPDDPTPSLAACPDHEANRTALAHAVDRGRGPTVQPRRLPPLSTPSSTARRQSRPPLRGSLRSALTGWP